MIPLVGAPIDRVDGRLKVTGSAKYSAEVVLPDLAYAALVLSSIASGTVVALDLDAARRAPGVIEVMTPRSSVGE